MNIPINGRSVRWHRRRLNMDQATLAREAGLSPSTIAAWENGRALTPKQENVRAVADVLGCSVAALQSDPPEDVPISQVVAPIDDLWHEESRLRNESEEQTGQGLRMCLFRLCWVLVALGIEIEKAKTLSVQLLNEEPARDEFAYLAAKHASLLHMAVDSGSMPDLLDVLKPSEALRGSLSLIGGESIISSASHGMPESVLRKLNASGSVTDRGIYYYCMLPVLHHSAERLYREASARRKKSGPLPEVTQVLQTHYGVINTLAKHDERVAWSRYTPLIAQCIRLDQVELAEVVYRRAASYTHYRGSTKMHQFACAQVDNGTLEGRMHQAIGFLLALRQCKWAVAMRRRDSVHIRADMEPFFAQFMSIVSSMDFSKGNPTLPKLKLVSHAAYLPQV